jgi:hypothetical protein
LVVWLVQAGRFLDERVKVERDVVRVVGWRQDLCQAHSNTSKGACFLVLTPRLGRGSLMSEHRQRKKDEPFSMIVGTERR